VAQIPAEDVDEFWRADAHLRAEVFEAIAKTGAKAVVTESTPPPDSASDWQRIGNKDYYVHFLACRLAGR